MNSIQQTNVIKPFDGNNFSNWLFRIKLILEQQEVLEVLNNDPPTDANELSIYKKNDVKARNIVIAALTDNVLDTIKECKSAKDIISTLKGTYERKGLANQVHLQQKLRTMKYLEKDPMSDFIMEFEKLISDLKACGGNITEPEIITQLLCAMPEKYQVVTTAIDIYFCQNQKTVTLEFVKNKLLMEETRQKKLMEENEPSTSQVFTTYKKEWENRSMKSNKRFKDYFPFRCHQCGKKGHKRTNCLQNSGRKECYVTENTSEESENEISFVASVQEEMTALNIIKTAEIYFVIDSGATTHLVNSEVGKYLEKCENVTFKINVAKVGHQIHAQRQGNLHLMTNNGLRVKIKNVLECQNISHNLLSVCKLQQEGIDVTFTKNKVKICKNGKELIEGDLQGNLYIVKFRISSNEVLMTEEEDLWHRRMGHSSKFPSNKICEICLQGKQTQFPYKPISDERKAKNILDIVSTDICGPINPATYNGDKYFISFIDHYSHFAVCYLMKEKSEAIEKFKMYIAMVETKHERKIKNLKCDNGGEYTSNQFQEICNQKGISVHFTIPHTPQQNGVAERFNRTIMEKARCLIFESKLQKQFWGEATRTAIYLLNRTESSVITKGKTPAEIWNNEKPNINKVRVFGCNAFVHIPKTNRGKMDPRSEKMLMMGYSSNGYRLWNPSKQKIITARNVIFDESKINTTKTEPQITIMEDIPEKKDATIHKNEVLEENENNFESEENFNANSIDRQKRSTKLPKRFEDYELNFMAALTVENLMNEAPNSYQEAVKEGNGWNEAISEELKSIEKNQTWEIVKTPENEEIIDSRWVFRKKEVNGQIIRKARLVARGYKQSEVTEIIYSPVARMLSVRILLSLSIQEDMYIHQLDVKCAFLNGFLKQPVYMQIPEGLEGIPAGHVCKLLKSLYGLKQSPKCWYDHLHEYLISIGFKRSLSDPCLYIEGNVYLLIHVDDLIIVSSSKQKICIIKEKLMNNFEMRDLTDDTRIKFLGLNIIKTKNELVIHQKDLIDKILLTFNMVDCKPMSVPIQPKLQLNLESSVHIQCVNLPYRQLIGCLMYLMLGSRPDLSFSIYYFSQFQNSYSETHWKHLKHVIKYLKATADFGLKYSKDLSKSNVILSAFVDSDFASNSTDRKSVTGYMIKLFDNVIHWKSKKQATVSLSSSEAEYIALSTCITECIFVKQLLEEMLGQNIKPINIYEDNNSCIFMASTLETKRSKHIDVKHHFIKDCVSSGEIKLNYISSDKQISDIFTKGLCPNRFKYFRELLNVCIC